MQYHKVITAVASYKLSKPPATKTRIEARSVTWAQKNYGFKAEGGSRISGKVPWHCTVAAHNELMPSCTVGTDRRCNHCSLRGRYQNWRGGKGEIRQCRAREEEGKPSIFPRVAPSPHEISLPSQRQPRKLIHARCYSFKACNNFWVGAVHFWNCTGHNVDTCKTTGKHVRTRNGFLRRHNSISLMWWV